MAGVVKSEGVTESERYLAKLGERNFLSLWSYPNLYTDEGRKNEKGQGKELCDLLVVFGDHVVIFSDKDIAFKDTGNLTVDWGRWVNRAVLKSAHQIFGAEKWIRDQPNRIFLDKQCSHRFPLAIPDPKTVVFHRIVVARNATKRFREHVRGRGSLIIAPEIIGDAHRAVPFRLGQVNPARGYVHVLDDVALDILLGELDTVSDFVNYLARKEKFVASGQLGMAAGEEELLAFYLRNLNEEGQHDFVVPEPGATVAITEGLWDGLSRLPQYLNAKKENKISYLWDSLIEQIAPHVFHGTLQYATTESVDQNALALRVMASESRVGRRVLANAFAEKFETTPADKRAVRTVFSPTTIDVGYVWLLYPRPDNWDNYEKHRQERAGLLTAYCHAFKAKCPQLRIIVGLACEPKGSGGGSEDLMYMDTTEWSDHDMEEARKIRQELRLLLDENVRETRGTAWEFPLPDSVSEDSTHNTTAPGELRKKQKRKLAEQRKQRRKSEKQSRRRNRKK